MFKKRAKRLTRIAEEIEKRRSGEGTAEAMSQKPRRVQNATFFSRIHEMQQKGGAGNVPLC